ncbi:restriction endonuclease subunit S [Vibrio cholerae]|nr:restriction endonuclease subunit S [Vibrio cholerae]
MIKPYPNYVRSDIKWVDALPENWKSVPFYTVASESKLSNKGMIEDNLLSLSFGRIKRKSIDTQGGLLPASFETYQIVNENDIIFRLTDLQNDKRSLRSAQCTERGIITSAYVAVTPSSIRSRYLHYLMRAYDETKVFYNLGAGMRQSLKYDELKRLPILLPPDLTQQAIEKFLDRETQRIDSLIEEKQTFITLLKEKRQALISHVVTKGLNPNVEMQDSGIEWIGQVPKHWEKCRVKQVSSFITSGPRGWSDFISDNGNAIFLQSGDLNNELGLNLAKAKKVSPPDGAEGQRTQLQLDDVVVCITGANTGRVALVKELDSTVYINQHLSLIRPIGEKVRPKYLAYFLSSEAGSRYYALEQYGLKEGLSLKNIAETPLMLPPVSEQTSIEKYLDKALAILSSLVTSVEESINLLKEHRTSLISAAVTGKIDVREAV